MVMELIDFSVDKTVADKEPDLGRHTGGKVVDVTEKENWTEDCALRNSRLHRDLVRGLALQHNPHTPLGEEGCEPGVYWPPDTVVVKLVKEFLVGHLVEGLIKVEDGYVDLLPSVEGREEVMSSC